LLLCGATCQRLEILVSARDPSSIPRAALTSVAISFLSSPALIVILKLPQRTRRQRQAASPSMDAPGQGSIQESSARSCPRRLPYSAGGFEGTGRSRAKVECRQVPDSSASMGSGRDRPVKLRTIPGNRNGSAPRRCIIDLGVLRVPLRILVRGKLAHFSV
jgi:hypothetical protein